MKNTTLINYEFVAESSLDVAAELYYFLLRRQRNYPRSFMTEVWDIGIGECKERLTALGCSFRTLRAGHAPMIVLPDGEILLPTMGAMSIPIGRD